MIQEKVRYLKEERRAVELLSQGAWTKWNLPKRKITLRFKETGAFPYAVSIWTHDSSKLVKVGHERGLTM